MLEMYNDKTGVDSIIRLIRDEISQGSITTENFEEITGRYYYGQKELCRQRVISSNDLAKLAFELNNMWIDIKKKFGLTYRGSLPESIDRQNKPTD
jgi:hypothetical protein